MRTLTAALVILGGVLQAWAADAAPGASADRLAGYWIMDEGAGDIIDECSGRSDGGKVAGQTTWDETERGQVLRFDGKSTTAKVPGHPAWDFGEGEMTISLWVKADRDAHGFILDHYFSGTPGVWGLMVEGGPVFALYDDAKKPVKAIFNGFRFNAWQHMAIVWRRAKDGWVRAYLNGELVGAIENVACTARYADDLHIGARQGVDQFFAGYVRDLALFSRALPPEEIAGIYKNGVKLATPVVISSLRADKLLYHPREQAAVSVRIKNLSDAPQKVDLGIDLISALNDRREVQRAPIELAPKRSHVVNVPVKFDKERYGCEVRATLAANGQPLGEKRDFFAVAENFWAVGIGSTWGSGLHTGLGQHRDIAERARKMYSNWFELFFWSPCDWALHVGPAKRWWSGQASYVEDEDNLKDLIARSHKEGIKVAFYASCNPAGPFGWEVARQHPDWFHRSPSGAIGGNYDVEAIEHWNDPEWRKTHPGNPGWFRAVVDLRNLQALDYGIDRLIDGAKHYGWDAVRFDGHYTIFNKDALSTANMRRMKERVWQQLPDFGFGFNYGRAPEWRGGVTHEMREAMAGGGSYMQEGIRNWRYTQDSYTSWRHYATNELRIAKEIQRMGGSYNCIWEAARLPAPQAYYKLVYGLIAGGHPHDSDSYAQAPGSPSWGAFMTRWSSMLWNLRLTGAEAEKGRFAVENATVQWQPLVQDFVDSETRKFVILHLVNPPSSDDIAKTEFPQPLGPFKVTYRPAEGTKVVAVRCIRPDALPFDEAIAPSQSDQGLSVTVPGVKHWTMLVWEVEGRFQVPAEPPRFTEPPDPQQVAAEAKAGLTGQIVDPQKEAVALDIKPNEQLYETDSGFQGTGSKVAADREATGGLAQMRDLGENPGTYPFMGRPYLGPVAPGRHRAIFRIKRDEVKPPGRAQLFVRVHHNEKDKDIAVAHLRSPGYPKEIGGPILTFGEPGKFQDYALEFELRESALVTCNLWPEGEQSPGRILLDHIRIETLERYSDAKLAEWNKTEKPVGLRTPNGARPAKVLLVKGMFAKEYRVEEATPVTAAYAFPKTYADLYACDAVVLANVDATPTDFATRKMLKDYVEDGGRLVILGGCFTLGQGGMAQTYLDEILPFQMKGAMEVVHCDPPLILGPKTNKPYGDKPAVFWRHDLAIRPDTEVLAWAGDKPIAARRKLGKGVVVVSGGTPLGEGDAQHTPFWSTKSWQELLRRLIAE